MITKEELTRPIVGIENRTAHEVFSIMCDRFNAAFAAMPVPSVKRGIYIASKTKHADRWRFLRDKVGEPIISTWIDEAEDYATLDWPGLWRRCISEASSAEVLIIYREPGEELKGAWVEMGAALTAGASVFAVGIEEFNVAKDARIHHFPDMKAAIATAREARILSPLTPSPDLASENERLRAALEFYANAKNYDRELVVEKCGCCSYWHDEKIGREGDQGEIARAALERT